MDKRAWLVAAVNQLKGSNKDNWVNDLPDDMELTQLGLDSLDIVELQMMYEEEVGYDIPDPVEKFTTIGGLLALMK